MNKSIARGFTLALVLMISITALTFATTSSTAAESVGGLLQVPVCVGLGCTAQEDCGSKCFCNRPSQKCYDDSAEQNL